MLVGSIRHADHCISFPLILEHELIASPGFCRTRVAERIGRDCEERALIVQRVT